MAPTAEEQQLVFTALERATRDEADRSEGFAVTSAGAPATVLLTPGRLRESDA
jgi:hypothetical protein